MNVLQGPENSWSDNVLSKRYIYFSHAKGVDFENLPRRLF